MTNKVVVQKVVGEICIRGEASSDRRDISMQDLLDIANLAAGNEGEVTGREGVNLTITMSGPDAPAAPLFTPAPDDNESYMDCRPKGVSYGQITPAAVVKEQNESNRRREEIVGMYRSKLRDAALGYQMTPEGFQRAIEAVICEAANIHRNMIMSADKDRDIYQSMMATNEKLLKEKKNLEQGLDEQLTRVSELNKQLSRHATTVDKIISTRREVEKELEGCKRQNEEYQRRLKVIRDHA